MSYGYMSGLGALGQTGGGPSRNEVMALQQAIEAVSGCNVGSTGVDGIFGSRTRTGLNCMISRQGGDAVRSQFPFVDFLLSYSGTYRPSTTSGGGGASGGQQQSGGGTRQAGAGAEVPWWGWALIAAGGAGLLAFVGLMLSGDGDDRGRDRRDRYDEDRYDGERQRVIRDWQDRRMSTREYEDRMADLDDQEYQDRVRRSRQTRWN